MTIRREDIAKDITLFCGDSREIMSSLGLIDSIVTDPPYGMAFQSNHRIIKHGEIHNDLSVDCLDWVISHPTRHSKYVFCRWDNLFHVAFPKSVITWIKNNWSMGDLDHEHARQTELILFYPGASHFFPSGRPSDVVDVRRTANNLHPTEKPVDLMWNIVSWTAGTVVDPFMGSGSTGVAAAKLGRPFIGIELDPVHFDTACRRISDTLRCPDFFAYVASTPSVQEELAL